MGAGHHYNIDKHILVRDTAFRNQNIVDLFNRIENLPLDEQVKAILESDDFSFLLDEESVIEHFNTQISTDTSTGKSVEQLSLDDYDHEVVFPYESIQDIAKETHSKFNAYDEVEYEPVNNGDYKAIGELKFSRDASDFAIKVAVIADGYNQGVITYLEDTVDVYYQPTTEDFLTIAMAEVLDRTDLIQQFIDHECAIDDWESIVEVYNDFMHRVSDTNLNFLIGEDNADWIRLRKLSGEIDSYGYDENMPEHIQNEMEMIAKRLSKTIHSNIIKEAKFIENSFNAFSDKFLDSLIKNYPSGTFYEATSPWTSQDYDPKEYLFTGEVSSTKKEKDSAVELG